MASIIMRRKIVGAGLLWLLVACRNEAAGRRDGGTAGSPQMRPSASVDVGDSNPSAVPPSRRPADDRPVVLFFGTSLTAGLGLEPEEAYPALLQQKIDSADLKFRAVNAGVSGETSAAGLRRIDWILQHPVAVLVLELGANDALRGLELQAAKKNLQEIIDHTRARYPDVRVVVAGMQAPPNLGSRYTREFREMFVDLARENHAALIPFLLQGVGGVDSLNQRDGIHPNIQGERIVADNVWTILRPLLIGG
jgi:acyl-CoA thioesterase-1